MMKQEQKKEYTMPEMKTVKLERQANLLDYSNGEISLAPHEQDQIA